MLIIGGGVAGVSCGLLLGSAMNKPYMQGRKVGLIAHQKASHLQSALFNNAYGIAPGTTGASLLITTLDQLRQYPVDIIEGEKVNQLQKIGTHWQVQTNRSIYTADQVVVATGYAQPFTITGLENYLQAHGRSNPAKARVELRNTHHFVAPGLYVAGSLAGHVSQLTIAAGSGAMVAADLLALFNGGNPAQVHDKIPQTTNN